MAQRGQFRVSVSRDDLVFSSAHFITYAGHRCEGLHGHNYRARVAVHGELDPTDKLVFDFLELKRIMRRCVERSITWCCCRLRARAFTWPKMLR
jgi:6-pyruvoyltetrahydropterin/6-carboxytetrahydropterin synthase